MRFVSLVNGVIGKVRRGVSQGLSVGVGSAGEDEATVDATKLVEALRQLTTRVNRLEANTQPDAVEFEVLVGGGGIVAELPHGLNGPVRWWVVKWMQTFANVAPILLEDPTSNSNMLYLRSYAKGKAVIRIERSQNFVEGGL